MSPTSYQAAPPRINQLSGECFCHLHRPTSRAETHLVSYEVRPDSPQIWDPARRGVMELATFTYEQGTWPQSFPKLYSPNTLIVGFAAPMFHDQAELWAQLKRGYPDSTVIGC